MPESFDLILEGGRVFDPSQDIDGVFDIGVRDGYIAAIRREMTREPAERRLDARGTLITPGLIDVHCHVYEAVTRPSVPVHEAGVGAGVTTVLDTGSAGHATFAGFDKFVIQTSRTRVFAFLHISHTGVAVTPEIRTREDIDIERTVQTATRYPDLIRGIKIRAVGPGIAAMGLEAFRLAKEAARAAKIPLMVHIGDRSGKNPQETTAAILRLLEAGDIVTHMYSGETGSIWTDQRHLFREVKDAMARGVLFDCAHGIAGCSFRVARKAIAQGILPYTISSDLSTYGQRSIVFSLTETMGKYLALGLSLKEVIRATTVNAAHLLRQESALGSLREGREADISFLRLVSGKWEFQDSRGDTIQGETAVVPVACVRKGKVIAADWGPRPWGWLPKAVDGQDPEAGKGLPSWWIEKYGKQRPSS